MPTLAVDRTPRITAGHIGPQDNRRERYGTAADTKTPVEETTGVL